MNQEYQYLVGKLQQALAADTRVNALDIKVTVVHGRLHLSGEVPSEERRHAVQCIAREVLPDLEVRNDITVIELADAAKPEAVDD
jgi:osmotically-inducible protein OsmY